MQGLDERVEEGIYFLTKTPLHQVLLHEIRGGNSSSKLYRFSNQGKEFVLKIHSTNTGAQAQRIASELGLSPKVLFSDPDSLVCIMPYIPKVGAHDLHLLAKTLKRLHETSELVTKQKSQLERLETHLQSAIRKGVNFPSHFHEHVAFALDSMRKLEASELTLCHGDLHPGNILMSESRYLFIDWALSSQDDPLSDVAYLTLHLCKDLSETKTFYSTYLGRHPTNQDTARLRRAQFNTCILLATALFDLCESSNDTLELDRLLNSLEKGSYRQYITGPHTIHPRHSSSEGVQMCALAFLKEAFHLQSVIS